MKNNLSVYLAEVSLKPFFIICFLAVNVISSGQDFMIKGKVISANTNPIEHFNVILLTKNDSSFVKGSSFNKGEFSFTDIEKQEYIIEFSGLGYKKKYIDINVSVPKMDLGEIILEEIKIEEISISAIKPTLKLDKDKLILGIENTYLSDIGTSIDVLKRTPMLIVDADDNITVAGKENVIVNIDGKKTHSVQELHRLNSSNIKKIEVITNPSAKYEASGHSIINIVTIKQKGKRLNGFVKTQALLAKKQRYQAEAYLGYKSEKVSIFGGYSLSDKSYENLENSYAENSVYNYFMDRRKIDETNILSHDYKINIDYSINEQNKIGFQYDGWYTYVNVNALSINNYTIDNSNGEIETNTIEDSEDYQNRFNINYNLKIDTIGQEINVLLDYVLYSQKKPVLINETENDLPIYSRFKENNGYNLYSLKLDYILPFRPLDLMFEAGVKYSLVTNESSTIFERFDNNVWQIDNNFDNNYDFTEEIRAAYISASKKINSLRIEAGLRFEQVDYNGESNDQSINEISYGKFFPSVLINYKFTDNLKASASYSRRIKRPTYHSLSPFVYYFDKYQYRQGNSSLEPTISDILEASLYISKKITVNIGYSFVQNKIGLSYSENEQNPEITEITTVNYGKSENFFSNIVHNFSVKKFSMYNSVGIKKPKMQINYLDEMIDLNKPTIYFNHSSEIMLPYKTVFSTSFIYQHLGHKGIKEYEPIYNLSFGITRKFLSKKLVVSIHANDVLRSENWRSLRRINNFSKNHEYIPDNTYVRATVKYSFGTTKSRFRSKLGNKEELRRL